MRKIDESSKMVRFDVADGVATLTLDRVEQRNALTPELASVILDHIDLVDLDESIGALVVTGAGPAFCAGGDLSWIRSAAASPISTQVVREFDTVYAVFSAVAKSRVPTIAAVGGATIGAGINLAAACDVRIVADDFVARGFAGAHIHPGGGHLALLRKCVGPQTAAAIMFFGKELDAEGAVESGFALEAVERAQLVSRAVELA